MCTSVPNMDWGFLIGSWSGYSMLVGETGTLQVLPAKGQTAKK